MNTFTLRYRINEGWYIGALAEMPPVISQGRTLAELEANILDAYELMLAVLKDQPPVNPGEQLRPIQLPALSREASSIPA